MNIESAGQVGRLWWSAESMEEALQWQNEYMSKGALSVELKPEDDRAVVDVIISLDMSTANEVVGYEVGPEEWLQ